MSGTVRACVREPSQTANLPFFLFFLKKKKSSTTALFFTYRTHHRRNKGGANLTAVPATSSVDTIVRIGVEIKMDTLANSHKT